jgi:molecular chaperone DnaK (HSP70)
LVETHNTKHKDFPELQVKVKGASNIELPSPLMSSFFQPLFENIKSKVEQLVGQVHSKKEEVDFIFMVGGFSESPFLKS